MTAPTPWEYTGTLVRMIDGDTAVLRLTKTFRTSWDFGFGFTVSTTQDHAIEHSCRLRGINAPEIEGPRKTEGLRSMQALAGLLTGHPLHVTTYKIEKYGRYLAEIDVTMPDGTVVNASRYMLDHGFAVAYDGTGPRT